MTPFFLRPLQLLSISLCFLSTFHSILYHSTLFKHLEQAKNSEKNKQGIFCFSSYSEYYFNKNGNNNQAEEVYLYSCKCTTTMKVWYDNYKKNGQGQWYITSKAPKVIIMTQTTARFLRGSLHKQHTRSSIYDVF